MVKNLVLAKAQNAVMSHDWPTAARLYKELLQGNESNVDYLKELGSIYVKAGEDEKAIPYYEQIITFYPHYVDAMNSLGAIYRRLKRYEESIQILQRAKDEGRNAPSVNYNLGFTYKEMGNYEDAIDAFETVISANPDDVLAYNHLGSIYFSLKNYEKSIASYKRGLQVDPNHPILNYNLARCYEASGNYADSVRCYELTLKTRPGWTDAIRDFSGLLIRGQKNKEAQDLVEKSIKLHPTDADLMCILGRIFLNQFDYDNATKTYKKAESIKPNDIKILTGLSQALEKGDNVEKALEKVLEAIDIDPYNKDARKQYIHTLLTSQRYDQALEQIKSLNEETKGTDLQTLDLYGQYYICRGDEGSAQDYFSKIQKLNHHYKDYMLNASDRFVQIGNLDKAEEFAKQFVERRSSLPDGYNRLGKIEEARGNMKSAKAMYEKGAACANPNVLAAKGLQKVNAELEKNPEKYEYETPPIEIDAEKTPVQEDYIPESFKGEVVGQEESDSEEFDYGQLGDNVPMGEALVEKEDDFWGDFDDDNNPEEEVKEEPLEEEEEEPEEEPEQPVIVMQPAQPENPFDDDMLNSLAKTGDDNQSDETEIPEDSDNLNDIANNLADDEEDFDFGDFDDGTAEKAEDKTEVPEEPENEPEQQAVPEPQSEPEMTKSSMPESEMPSAEPYKSHEPPVMPEPPKQNYGNYQQPAYDPMLERQMQAMQAASMNNAGNAMEAAFMAQKMVQQLTDQQNQFEERMELKNEKMIHEEVKKAVEEKMQKSMDDQMARIMTTNLDTPEEKKNDLELPSENEAVDVEVKPIESIMDVDEKPEHEQMDEFLANTEEAFAEVDDFAEEGQTPAEENNSQLTAEDAAAVESLLSDEPFAEVDEFGEKADTVAEEVPEEEAPEAADEEAFAEVDELAGGDRPLGDEDSFAEVDEFATGGQTPAEEASEINLEEKAVQLSTENAELEPLDTTLTASVDEIEQKLSKTDEAEKNAEQIELFKTLRVLSRFLPENEKDSFLSCKIRMIIEYIIAKMSGKPGLLITAEALLDSGILGNEYKNQLKEDSDEKISNEMIKQVLTYMKSLAENLEDKQLSKALCVSADNILEKL